MHSMAARKCVHAQKPYSCQAFAHESSNEKREEERQGKTEARRLMERKVAQQNQKPPTPFITK